MIRKENPRPICIILDNARFLDFDKVVERSVEVAIELFGERKHGYAKVLGWEFISAEN